jgi:acetyl-CoA carboxylase biotin carboxyl carrier protein
MIDLEFLRGLIDAVDGSGIDSLEISRGGTRIRISKTPPSAHVAVAAAPAPAPAHLAAPAPVHPEAAAGARAAASVPAGGGEAAPAAAKPGLVEVKSPMVGTFYRSPAPEAPPYVEVGSRVARGQTLCILEAMKLMNELESDVAGVVREVCVENGEPVEYGQVLFRIEPTG